MIQLLVYAKGRRQDKYKYYGMHVQAYMCRTHIRNVLGIPQKYMANIGQVEKGIRTKHPSAGMADEKNQGWSDEEWQQWWDGWNENWQHAWEERQYYAGAAGAKDEPPSAVCNPIWQSMSAEMFGGLDLVHLQQKEGRWSCLKALWPRRTRPTLEELLPAGDGDGSHPAGFPGFDVGRAQSCPAGSTGCSMPFLHGSTIKLGREKRRACHLLGEPETTID